MTTPAADISGEFITTDIAHRDCNACAGCADRARTTAKVTGSVGSTESVSIGPSYDRTEHYATVHRADRMHELHHAATEEPEDKPVSILDRTTTLSYLDASGATTDLLLASGSIERLVRAIETGEKPEPSELAEALRVATMCKNSYRALAKVTRA